MRINFGMLRHPSGQLGNQLFQLNFLLQLEQKLGTQAFRFGFNLEDIFETSPNKFRRGCLKTWNFTFLKRENIELLSLDDSSSLIAELSEMGKIAIIPPGILGKNFFNSIEVHPRALFPIKRVDRNAIPNIETGLIRVGIHFRGGDFERWNTKASMSFDFYQRAIIEIQKSYLNSQLIFELYTDDPSHPVVRDLGVLEYINYAGYGDAGQDFIALANCDVIIAGPSTFAFWASILFKDSDLVMSAEWFSHCEDVADVFWLDAKNSYEEVSGKLIIV